MDNYATKEEKVEKREKMSSKKLISAVASSSQSRRYAKALLIYMESSARTAYGVTIVVLPLLFMILYLPILLIFFVDKEFRKVSAYIIMTHIGVLDALQLLIHSYSGVLVLASVDLGEGMKKVVGAILTGLWFSGLAFTLFLTLNRFITVLLQKWFPQLTSNRLTCALFVMCYFCFIVPFVLKLLPQCNYTFDPDTFSWTYLPTDSHISIVMNKLGNYLVLAIVVLSIITYVSIFGYIGFFSQARLSKREYWITVQVSLLVLYFLFSFIYWTYLMPIFGSSVVSDFVSCLVWVVMNGIHPIIYLIFNHSCSLRSLKWNVTWL
ncbi:hypothetical protein RB195_013837 [Necator americanus]|uniref:7TM GPCR serpentine receptor class x (Srx) domain-containing protein n=1 Tax=Necator americanus TaxID=51031 RepID=A0ABR1DXI4_NECAM